MKKACAIGIIIALCGFGLPVACPLIAYAEGLPAVISSGSDDLSLGDDLNDYRDAVSANNNADLAQVKKLCDATVCLDNAVYEYTGEAVEPHPLVSYEGVLLSEGIDYRLSYANNIVPGAATVVLSGLGDFAGSYTVVTFGIVRSANNLISLPGSWRRDSNGWWYALDGGGYLKSCVQIIDGVKYRFNESGYLYCGWYLFDNAWHYSNPSGAIVYGWSYVNGSWFYLDSHNGSMKTGWVLIDGSWYYFDTSGIMRTGWVYLNGTWYYMLSSGAMNRGWGFINGSWYFFAEDGAMRTGWLYDNDHWYYLNGSGEMAHGWLLVNGVWYYLSGSGSMAVGLVSIAGADYYFDSSGSMRVGWISTGDGWYFASESGALKSGWLLDGTEWYWLDPNDNDLMAVGKREIAGSLFYFNDDGKMLSRSWVKLDRSAVHASVSGAIDLHASLDEYGNVVCMSESGDRYSGWKILGSSWYFFEPDGLFVTGWKFIGGNWYYFYSDGSMALGWIYDSESWYYFGNSGAMISGWHWIDGHYYQFGSDGSLREPQTVASSDLQRRLVSACYSVPSPGPGLCSEWVASVFARIGLGQMLPNNDYDADDMFYAYCNSDDLRALRVGMIIAVPSHTHTYAGSIWGHICIYIGNNTVMDNIGRIRSMPLDAWLDYYTTTFSPRWGWYNHCALV